WFSPFKTMIFRDSAVISCGKCLKWPYDISEGVPVRAFVVIGKKMKSINTLYVLLMISSCTLSEKSNACNNIDIKYYEDGYDKLNSLVCEAFKAWDDLEYSKSISLFEEAANIEIFETPNIKYYPILTELYWKIGDVDNAQKNLQISKLSLEIVLGIVECRWNGFSTTDNITVKQALDEKLVGIYRSNKIVKEPYGDYVFLKMCNENMLDGYIKNAGLDTIYRLSKEYFDVKSKFGGNLNN
ncbi:hypothetical protein ACFODZ_17095, partial [Marinicella sediminis]